MHEPTRSSNSNPGSIRSLSAKADGNALHSVTSNKPLDDSVEAPNAATSHPILHAILVNLV